VLGARRRERLEELAAEHGDRVAVVEMDVRDPAGSEQLVGEAVDRFGRLDAIVVNAGIGMYGGIMDLEDDQLREMVDTNVNGTVWPIRAAVPRFLAAGEGDIVIVSSVAGPAGCGRRGGLRRDEVRPGRLAGGARPRASGEAHPGQRDLPGWDRHGVRDGARDARRTCPAWPTCCGPRTSRPRSWRCCGSRLDAHARVVDAEHPGGRLTVRAAAGRGRNGDGPPDRRIRHRPRRRWRWRSAG
jgi:hypothetical protein